MILTQLIGIDLMLLQSMTHVGSRFGKNSHSFVLLCRSNELPFLPELVHLKVLVYKCTHHLYKCVLFLYSMKCDTSVFEPLADEAAGGFRKPYPMPVLQ